MLLGLYGHVGKKLALTTTFPLEVATLFSSMQKMLFVCDQSSLFPPSFFSLKKLDETNRCPSMINISLPPHRSWCRQTFWHHFAYKQVLTLHKCHGKKPERKKFLEKWNTWNVQNLIFEADDNVDPSAELNIPLWILGGPHAESITKKV